jgi:hypothetical protein
MKKLLKILFRESSTPKEAETVKRKIRALPPMILHNEIVLTNSQYDKQNKEIHTEISN